ncbi:MAG TPA: S8 family serine peptidase [Bdellovibrionales bacterium]|nr:S8 family serine peptidase [Bdellovibrionales bacterium]
MRSKLWLALGIVFLSGCSAPKTDGDSDQPSTSSCGSVSTASVQAQSAPKGATPLSKNPKLKLDLTPVKLSPALGPQQLFVDFKSQAFQDPKQIVVPAGTRLVAVVDHACTKSKGYTIGSADGSLLSERIMNKRAEKFQNAMFGKKIHSHSVELETDMTLEALEALADSDACLTMLSSNIRFEPFVTYPPDDTSLGSQTHLPFIKYQQAYNKFFDNPAITTTVVIAIIDSGVDVTHGEFTSTRWTNTGETAGNGVDDDSNGYIDDRFGYNFASDIGSPAPQAWPYPYTGSEGHGTHVAGLAAAATNNSNGIAGVMGMNVRMMALNVFGTSPSADTAVIDEAIRYAIAEGAQVINLSLGGLGRVASTGVALQEAITAGVVVVAAAGNSNVVLNSGTFMTPASYGAELNGMISVGSVDAVDGARSSFSNCGNTIVEIAAPGAHDSGADTSSGGLLSTLPSGSYGRSMGTSMASPIVAGAAGLAIGLKMRMSQAVSPAAIESSLLSTATTDSTLTPYFKNGKVLNLEALANSISP